LDLFTSPGIHARRNDVIIFFGGLTPFYYRGLKPGKDMGTFIHAMNGVAI
jgi:hypothetical protein